MAHYRLVAMGQLFGAWDCFNSFYFQIPNPQQEANAVSLAGDWITAMYTPVLSILSNAFTLKQFSVSRYDTVNHVFETEEFGSINIAGTDQAEVLPLQNAAVVIAYTGVKRMIGKKFLGGLTSGTIDGALLASGAVVALGNFAAKWLEGVVVNQVTLLRPSLFRKETGVFYEPTIMKVDNLIGSQRRRKIGVGA